MGMLVAGIAAAQPLSAAPLKGVTGEPLAVKAFSRDVPEMVYYIYDWGDGTWTPSGRVYGDAGMEMEHAWKAPGDYTVRWMAMSLSGRGSAWHSSRVTIKDGAAAARPEFLAPRAIIAGSGAINASRPEQLQPLKTMANWESPESGTPLQRNWLALDFGEPRTVDWVVLTRHAGEPFPEFFSVEYKLDASKEWQPIMSAVFVFFPDPGKNAVWIPLRGLAASAIRISSPRASRLSNGKYGVALGSVQAIAGPAPIFSGGPNPLRLALWDNLWLNYGLAANEVIARGSPWWQTERPLDGGALGIPSCEWLFWDASKLTWIPDHPEMDALLKYIRDNPVGKDGYAWPSPGSEKHLGHSRHTVTNPIYAMAVARAYLQTRDRSFLEAKDSQSGESVLDKARRAMSYQIDTLGGRSGLLTVEDPEIDGTAASKGDNYWDFWLFGGRSAYNNAYFYESLRWMAELEAALGNEARAHELRELRPLVKKRFNETFWDETKGRYIGWIDKNGEPHDYGFTFVNLPALAWGLADPARAGRVLDWLDGKRQIDGDDSTGRDIYAFGFAPRSNTVDAVHGSPLMVNTWDGALDIRPGGNAAFGQQIQNGGAIFYVSYYDLMARLRVRGIVDAMSRMDAILAEAAVDEIRRDPANMRGHSDIAGILREFPESGLVPLFFLDGVLGIELVADGLRIHPALPPDWNDAAVREYAFAGKKYRLVADAKINAPVRSDAGGWTTWRFPAKGDWLLDLNGNLKSWKDAK